MSKPDLDSLTTLQLGDIISFDAPVNPELHDRVFLIKYIDDGQITIVDEETLKELTLSLDDEGNLTDQSVEAIAIIDRVNEPGYAKQNDLVPGKWINLRFGGDIPVVITGEITNLEEDMIEVKTHPDGDVIYIDFAYKGIPKNLPIEKIEIRNTPDSARPEREIKDYNDGRVDELDDTTKQYEPVGHEDDIVIEEMQLPEKDDVISDVKAQLREMIIGADQIQIGEDLGVIEQEVNVSESGVRFGIEKQVNDMLDDMLSTIPNAQRTQTVLTSIHRMIDRFIELRKEYSIFDEQGNANAPALHGPTYKPLVNQLMKLDHNILWLLPIAKNRKRLFVTDSSKDDDENIEGEGIIEMTMNERETEITRVLQDFKENQVGDGQNKYDYMVQQLNTILSPFILPLGDSEGTIDGVITTRNVGTNLTAVIDNLGDLYTMVMNDNGKTTSRFFIAKYELGEDKLQQTRLRNGQLAISRVPITTPQKIAIKGFLTLPENISRFSKVNMPRTNIMVRSELAQHYINYWQILRKTTAVENTVIDNLNEPIDYDKSTFLKKVRSYMLDTSSIEGENYETFLTSIIPKTRVLFELVKRHIKNAYSLHSILEYMEPFFVYHSDLSFKQYEAMTGYIRNQIKNYKKSIAESHKEFLYIQSLNEPESTEMKLINLLGFSKDKNDDAINEENLLLDYNIIVKNPENDGLYTVASYVTEQLFRIISLDNGAAFTSVLAANTVDLMVPDGELLEELNEDIQEAQRELFSKVNDGLCQKYTIAKKYLSIDELEEDNDTDVYFDRKFDRTNYDLLKKYQREKRDMGENFIPFIAKKLADENHAMTPTMAEREAIAIVEGKRLVEEGDFAVLMLDDGENNRTSNYIRKSGIWVLSDVQDNLLPTVNLGAFCVAKEQCIPTKDGCENADALLQSQSEVNTLKDSIRFFAELYPKQRQQLKSYIQQRMNDALQTLETKATMEFRRLTKYTRNNYLIGMTAVDSDKTESPYAPLRDLILSQGDFVKKQYDILRFVTRFTFVRQLSDGSDDPYWLYCNTSGLPLIPSYMDTLANAFVNYPDTYTNVLQEICADRGTISDDGEKWVDKHSGYVICPIQYDNEEGYTAQGYKMKTRSQMEADLGDAVLLDENKERNFEGKDANMVASSARALALIMGVNMNTDLEFIVRNVLTKQKAMMPSEEVYNKLIQKAAKSGKKIKQVSYENAYISNMMFLMFCYYIIALQTSIPEIKTNKTFPGCKRAFGGYPIDGTTDLSAITYVACLVQQLKKVEEQPWASISKENEISIVKRIQAIMDKSIINDPEIQEKIAQKKEYLQLQIQEDIPEEHDIRSWTNFLPPLVSPEVSKLQPLSNDFEKKFISEIRNGSSEQFKSIRQAQSRAMDYSIAIQTLIHKVVSSQKSLLNNAANEPFLQNACCETEAPICLDYFANREPDITRYNDIVRHISEMLFGASIMTKAPLFYDPRDTRIVYPPISTGFSDDTIYQAVISYCSFNSPLPISPELLSICHEKPADLNINDAMPELIAQLKRSGRVYTRETLEALMSVVNKEHIVHINLDTKVLSKIQGLRDILMTFRDMSEPIISKEASTKLIDILDVFDMKQNGKDVSLETRQLRNHLSSLNKSNILKIEDFITRNSNKMKRTEKKKINHFLSSPTNLPASSSTHLLTAEENGVYRDLLFAQNIMRNIVLVIPNTIINGTKSISVPKVPKHWGLSEKHTEEILDLLLSHFYEVVMKFNNYEPMILIMKSYYAKYHLLVKLIDHLVYLAPMPGFDNITVLDDVTVKLLIDYLITSALLGFVEFSDDTNALETSMAQNLRNSRDLITMTDVSVDATGDIDALAILRGESEQLREKMADFLKMVISITIEQRSTIDYDYQSVMEDVHQVKEIEKDYIVSSFAKMTDEEREIENLFKKSKLGKWSKGLKKSVFQYVAEDYDQEREEMEKRMNNERRINNNQDVTVMNRDIYLEELEADERAAMEIDQDAYDMSYMGEDDDDGYDPDE